MRLGSHCEGHDDRMSTLWTCVYWDAILRTAGVLLCLVWPAEIDTFRNPDHLYCQEQIRFSIARSGTGEGRGPCRAPCV